MDDGGIKCLGEIRTIIKRLRGDNGCPWDRKQTPDSVKTYIIEEAHEAVDAIRRNEVSEIVEELGDLIFMVFFVVHLFEERGFFTLEDVCQKVCKKMIHRHPHVFGSIRVRNADEVKENWDKLKKLEGKDSKAKDGIPSSLPALIRAYRLIARGIIDEGKEVDTQIFNTLLDAINNHNLDEIMDEDFLGKAILKLVYLGKLYGIRAEDALQRILDKIQGLKS